MASLAHDRNSGAGGSSKAGKGPLSTHPAFPFIVALWFAALLGIGSLVVPVPVIERLVTVTGLSSLVPQTAPPLGFTARALIALVCTVGGGLAGLLIARKVGRAHRQTVGRFDRTVAGARRPIAAHHELGEDGFDGPIAAGAPRGRRALAIVEEEGPSEVFDLAPLPGKPLPLSALDLREAEALELADSEMLEGDWQQELEPTADVAQPGFTTLAESPEIGTYVMQDRQQFTVPSTANRQQFFVPGAAEPAEPVADVAEIAAAPGIDEVVAADLHFSPPSLARPFAQSTADFAEGPEDEAPEEMAVESPLDEPAPAPAPAPVTPVDWEDGELDDLALVQLAQRLGSSIARRREVRAAEAAEAAAAVQRLAAAAAALASAPASIPAAMPAVLAEEFDAAEAAEAAQAMAAYFGAPKVEIAPPAPAPAFTSSAPETPFAMHSPIVTPMVAPHAAPMPPVAGRQMFQPAPPAAPAPLAAPLAGLAYIDLGEEDEDEDDGIAHLTASFSLPLSRPAPFAAPVATSAAEPDPAPMANPFLQRAPDFVRIENEPQPEEGMVEPAVVFPGEAAFAAPADTGVSPFARPAPATAGDGETPPRASAEENERALREALLNLQRMSSVG